MRKVDSGVIFVAKILIKACRLTSIKEHLDLLLMIFIQEKLCSQIYIDSNKENIFQPILFIHGNFSAKKENYRSQLMFSPKTFLSMYNPTANQFV